MRAIENGNDDTWRNMSYELCQHLVTVEYAEGRMAQRSATTTGRAEILSALGIPKPGRFLDFELPTTSAQSQVICSRSNTRASADRGRSPSSTGISGVVVCPSSPELRREI